MNRVLNLFISFFISVILFLNKEITESKLSKPDSSFRPSSVSSFTSYQPTERVSNAYTPYQPTDHSSTSYSSLPAATPLKVASNPYSGISSGVTPYKPTSISSVSTSMIKDLSPFAYSSRTPYSLKVAPNVISTGTESSKKPALQSSYFSEDSNASFTGTGDFISPTEHALPDFPSYNSNLVNTHA